ncbi:MAG: 3'(2'),5'-bisphosphate nucleotidase CysQ [Syntrophobacteria bacterium]
MSDKSLQQLLRVALSAGKAAAGAILSVYRGRLDIEYKDDDTPLTLADKRAHAIIVDHLSREPLKQIPILSEEGRHTAYEQRKRWDCFWLVDPLDGTKEFIKQRGEFTVNIALIHQRKPVLGVVFAPASTLVYFAARGVGSFKLDSTSVIDSIPTELEGPQGDSGFLDKVVSRATRLPLHQPGTRPGSKLRVVGSRSHATKGLVDFVEDVKQRYGEAEFFSAGSALKFGLVAEGSADIYPRFSPTMEWDTAAGQCVVEESGGTVLSVKEKAPLHYNKKDLTNPYFLCCRRHFSA